MRRSTSLPKVDKLDIGLKLDGIVGSRSGFFSRGVICAVLKSVGKVDCEKDLFAISVSRCANRSGQSLKRQDAKESIGDGLRAESMTYLASAIVTGSKLDSAVGLGVVDGCELVVMVFKSGDEAIEA